MILTVCSPPTALIFSAGVFARKLGALCNFCLYRQYEEFPIIRYQGTFYYISYGKFIKYFNKLHNKEYSGN